jgi:ABC-type multidrug transport system permease subunit
MHSNLQEITNRHAEPQRRFFETWAIMTGGVMNLLVMAFFLKLGYFLVGHQAKQMLTAYLTSPVFFCECFLACGVAIISGFVGALCGSCSREFCDFSRPFGIPIYLWIWTVPKWIMSALVRVVKTRLAGNNM